MPFLRLITFDHIKSALLFFFLELHHLESKNYIRMQKPAFGLFDI